MIAGVPVPEASCHLPTEYLYNKLHFNADDIVPRHGHTDALLSHFP